MDKTELFNRIKGKLIISCQALPGEPLYDPERTLMPYMARAAREAGSPMIRANTVRDVLGIKKETGLPVIGLIKQVYEGYDGYITPTMREVDALAEAGADIIAVDCTDRKRGDGLSPWEYIGTIKEKYPDQILMADISDYQDIMTDFGTMEDFDRMIADTVSVAVGETSWINLVNHTTFPPCFAHMFVLFSFFRKFSVFSDSFSYIFRILYFISHFL